MDGDNRDGVNRVNSDDVEVLATNDPATMRRERAEAVRTAHDAHLETIIDRALDGECSKAEARALIDQACDEYLVKIKEIFNDE